MLLHLVADSWDRWLRAQVYHITEFQKESCIISDQGLNLLEEIESTSQKPEEGEKNRAALKIGRFEDIG